MSSAPVDQFADGFDMPPNMDALAAFLQTASRSGRQRGIEEFMIKDADHPELLAIALGSGHLVRVRGTSAVSV